MRDADQLKKSTVAEDQSQVKVDVPVTEDVVEQLLGRGGLLEAGFAGVLWLVLFVM